MVNRYLSLLVSAVAPAAAAAMLIAGTHPSGTVTAAERVPCFGLALLALTLAIVHLRIVPTRAGRAEAAMWSGLSVFLFVATFASPNLGVFTFVAALSLAATSVARLVSSHGRSGAVAQAQLAGHRVT
jgi:hypothetical protein